MTPENNFESAFALRPATAADVPTLLALVHASVRGLQALDHTPTQIEGALATVFGVDSQLIEDGTYFVVESISSTSKVVMVGCGGWSKRRTLYGSDDAPERDSSPLDPRTDAAKIRAFFVHPDWARRGIGSFLLAACERAAAQAGFRRFEMGATLTGVPLYRAKNYVELERLEVLLKNGERLPIVRMHKSL